MGWFTDDGAHEGYLVAVVQKDGLWRELGYELPWVPVLKDGAWYPIETVQVGCDCGWRSPRLLAAAGTRWAPHTVDAPEHFEDHARAIWLAHIEEVRKQRASRPAPAHPAPRSSPERVNRVEAPDPSLRSRGRSPPKVVDLAESHRRIVALARSFPSLREADGLEPWDAVVFADWLRSGAVTSGSAHAGRFILAVWGGSNEALNDQEVFALGGFDAADAFHVWDEPHRRAFHVWSTDPWYP